MEEDDGTLGIGEDDVGRHPLSIGNGVNAIDGFLRHGQNGELVRHNLTPGIQVVELISSLDVTGRAKDKGAD